MLSTCRSSSSLNFSPPPENTLMPLSSNGLCDAEMTTPAVKSLDRVRYATPGVGMTPALTTSAPHARAPCASSRSSHTPDSRVSRPMSTRGAARRGSARTSAAPMRRTVCDRGGTCPPCREHRRCRTSVWTWQALPDGDLDGARGRCRSMLNPSVGVDAHREIVPPAPQTAEVDVRRHPIGRQRWSPRPAVPRALTVTLAGPAAGLQTATEVPQDRRARLRQACSHGRRLRSRRPRRRSRRPSGARSTPARRW